MSISAIWQALSRTGAARPFVKRPTRKEIRFIGKFPEVMISADAMTVMYGFVDRSREEIGWLGTAYRQEDGNILIEEVFLFEQDVSSTHTRIGVDGQKAVVKELCQQGGEKGKAKAKNLFFWGHSHNEMECHPSRQDDDRGEKFRDGGAKFFVRGIFNRKGDIRFDIYDFDLNIQFMDCDWQVVGDEGNLFQNVEDDIKKKIRRGGDPTGGSLTRMTAVSMAPIGDSSTRREKGNAKHNSAS